MDGAVQVQIREGLWAWALRQSVSEGEWMELEREDGESAVKESSDVMAMGTMVEARASLLGDPRYLQGPAG